MGGKNKKPLQNDRGVAWGECKKLSKEEGWTFVQIRSPMSVDVSGMGIHILISNKSHSISTLTTASTLVPIWASVPALMQQCIFD